MTTTRVYHTLLAWLRQLRPGERMTRVRTLAALMGGIVAARAVQLPRVAQHMPSAANERSSVRRLERWLDNPAVRVRTWHRPIAAAWLRAHVRTTGPIRWLIDTSPVGGRHHLGLVALAVQRRAIPLAWTWLRGRTGHSSQRVHLARLAAVRALLPDGAPVLLAGDTEFEAVRLHAQAAAWGWQYVVRQKPNNQLQAAPQAPWQALGSLVTAPGRRVGRTDVRVTRVFGHPANGLAAWAVGARTPWLLAANPPTARATLRAYRRRMGRDERFGDRKGHGFDLEQSHGRSFARLSRLTLAVVLLSAWWVATGVQVIKRGMRTLVDRNDRRDVSVFQIGLRYLFRQLKNGQPVTVIVAPDLKLSGS